MLFDVNIVTSFPRIIWDAWYLQRAGSGLCCIDVARNVGPESAVMQSRVRLAQPDMFAISIRHRTRRQFHPRVRKKWQIWAEYVICSIDWF
jgi:hypothetical protein